MSITLESIVSQPIEMNTVLPIFCQSAPEDSLLSFFRALQGTTFDLTNSEKIEELKSKVRGALIIYDWEKFPDDLAGVVKSALVLLAKMHDPSINLTSRDFKVKVRFSKDEDKVIFKKMMICGKSSEWCVDSNFKWICKY